MDTIVRNPDVLGEVVARVLSTGATEFEVEYEDGEEHVVVRIKRLPFWRQPFTGKSAFFLGVWFAVEYVDLLGITLRALCNSGCFQGVEWLEDLVVDDP